MEPATHAELPTLKILLIGSSNVGKSALVLRFTKDAFLGAEDASATIGVDYQIKSICVQGKWFKLSIWDTAGQERYRTLTSSYYRGAQGVVLGRFEEMLTPVYDVTNTESFDALPSWLKELDTFSDEVKPVILLAGNKVDEASARVISTEQGEAFAKAHGCLFAECSAKEAVGVDHAFDELVQRIASEPDLWIKVAPGVRRPGDRIPGGAPDQAGIISLNAGAYVGAVQERCGC